MPQLIFHFEKDINLFSNDFFTSPANQAAHKLITSWPNWFGNITLIYGEKSSGKSHLCNIWKDLSKARFVTADDLYNKQIADFVAKYNNFIIDDIEKIHDEVAFFHFFNQVNESKKYLLLTSSERPNNLSIRLPDLKSRICAITSCAIESPDIELVRSLIAKQFSDRQLKVSADVIEYLSTRCVRSYADIRILVDTLEEKSLIEHKNITKPFARKIFHTDN